MRTASRRWPRHAVANFGVRSAGGMLRGSRRGGNEHQNRVAVRVNGVDDERFCDGLNPAKAALRDALGGMIGRRSGAAPGSLLRSWLPAGVLACLLSSVLPPGGLACLLGDGGQNETCCQGRGDDKSCAHWVSPF